jgi:hypothetical protein
MSSEYLFSGRRVLLVEDEPIVAWLLKDMLVDLDLVVVGPAAAKGRNRELRLDCRVDALRQYQAGINLKIAFRLKTNPFLPIYGHARGPWFATRINRRRPELFRRGGQLPADAVCPRETVVMAISRFNDRWSVSSPLITLH